MSGQIKFLNNFGDITIEWDEQDHIKMLTIIQDKLNNGFQFFIIKEKFMGIPLTGGKKELKKVSQLSGNKVLIKDKDIEKYFNSVETAKIIEDDKRDTFTVLKGSTNAEEIAKHTSVCSKPAKAG